MAAALVRDIYSREYIKNDDNKLIATVYHDIDSYSLL